jgi:hypothetical protein
MKTKREIVYGFFRLKYSQKINIVTSMGSFAEYHKSRGPDFERFKAFLYDLHENYPESFYETLAERIADAEADNLPIAEGDAILNLASQSDLGKVLLLIAPSHQGGNSSTGQLIAEALTIPFPINMRNLTVVAKQMGHDPAVLWPWFAKSRMESAQFQADQRDSIMATEPSIDDIANEFMETNDGA